MSGMVKHQSSSEPKIILELAVQLQSMMYSVENEIAL